MVATVSLLPRLLAPVIREALTDTPVVCVVGPRQSGKTTLVQHLAPERAFFSLDENNYYQTSVLDPSGFVAALPGCRDRGRGAAGSCAAPGHQARRGSGPPSRPLSANRFGQSVAGADGHRVAGRPHGDRAVTAVDGSGKGAQARRVPNCPVGSRSQTPYQARNNRRPDQHWRSGWWLEAIPNP